jgi:hypothetical protein
MTQREKLIEKMRNSPGSIRFSEVDSFHPSDIRKLLRQLEHENDA